MFRHLFARDVHRILTTHTFLITVLLLTITMSMGFIVNAERYFDQKEELTRQQEFNLRMVSSQSDYQTAAAIGLNMYRSSYILNILEQGITNSLGRKTVVSDQSDLALDRSENLENPILSLFRELDLSFAAITLLSLMAILLTYDSICGERQDGTLKLMLANSLPRHSIIFSKIFSTFVCLCMAIVLSFIVSVGAAWTMYPQIIGLLVTGDVSIRILFILIAVFMSILVWVCIGTLISSLVHQPSTSFIISFVIWLLLVAIVPQLSVVISERIMPTNSYAATQSTALRDIAQQREDRLGNVNTRERWQDAVKTGTAGSYLAEVARIELNLQQEVLDRNLNEHLRQQQAQISIASTIARSISPAAALEFTLQQLTGSGWNRQTEYLWQLRAFKQQFINSLLDKLDAIRPEVAHDQWDLIYQNKQLDIAKNEISFEFAEPGVEIVMEGVIQEFGTLILMSIVLFFASVIAFNRYDIR